MKNFTIWKNTAKSIFNNKNNINASFFFILLFFLNI